MSPRISIQQRRPRPRTSCDDHRLTVIFALLLLIDASSAASRPSVLSPVSVGLRSALASSSLRRRTFGSRPRNLARHQQVLPVAASSEEEDSLVESAFLRIRTPEDAAQWQQVDYAVLRSRRTREAPESELELLESLAVPCRTLKAMVPRERLVDEPAETLEEEAAAAAAAAAETLEDPETSETPNSSTTATHPVSNLSGGATAAARTLVFWETMICGAISRSVAQTVMHPANTMKTLLQSSRGATSRELLQPKMFRTLSRGAGANFVLSVPHGAINFAVLEFVRKKLADLVEATPYLAENAERLGPGLDFLSSALSTITCSVVSTPQMMITDNIMAGNYPNLAAATTGLARDRGMMGFYSGWWPGLVGKIPSYALTWTFFQQLKNFRNRISDRPATNVENSIMGCVASATTVCIMIPMDTIKTRLVTQTSRVGTDVAYKGIVDCAVRVFKEEGIATFYRGLPPRLVSVVPMIGIQFTVYEAMKRVMVRRQLMEAKGIKPKKEVEESTDEYGSDSVLQEAAMEVAASPEHPFPAPQFHEHAKKEKEDKKKAKKKLKKKLQGAK